MESNGRFDLDLTPFVEPIKLKIGSYECSLLPDMPLPILVDMRRAFSSFTDLEEIDESDLIGHEERIWHAAEAITAHATPPPEIPIRQLLTFGAAIRLLSFLMRRFAEAAGAGGPIEAPVISAVSSQSFVGTGEASISET